MSVDFRPRSLADAALSILIFLLVAGCGPTAPPPASTAPPHSAAKPDLIIAAAGDLREAIPAIAERFEAKAGRHVAISFGASGQLAEQIRNGGPFAVFLSANRRFVRELADQGQVVPESVAPYATGVLVLAVNPALAPPLPTLGDLDSDARVGHVAIANPKLAPYGNAARQALEASGEWAALEPKLVPVDSVDQAAQLVATGSAEAGLISISGAKARSLAHEPVDPALYEPLVQYLGVTKAGSTDPDASAFAAFLNEQFAREVFAAHGFGPPPSTP